MVWVLAAAIVLALGLHPAAAHPHRVTHRAVHHHAVTAKPKAAPLPQMAIGCPIPNPNINGPPFIDGCPIPATALNRMAQPPGPVPAPVCPFGNAVIGYTAFGTKMICGTAAANGSIANGSNQIAAYIGGNSIGPLTPGGDLNFANPNFTVTGLQGKAVSSAAPATGQVLQWNGAAWTPAQNVSGAAGSNGQLQVNANGSLAGLGIGTSLTSNGTTLDVNNGGITPAKLATGTAASNIGALGSDLTGSLPNPTVTGIQGRPVASASPTAHNPLQWSGTQWAPGLATGAAAGTYTCPTITVDSTGYITTMANGTCSGGGGGGGGGIILTGSGVTLTGGSVQLVE